MPFTSQAQWRQFFAMERRGELAPGTAEKWARESPAFASLPAHVGVIPHGPPPTPAPAPTSEPAKPPIDLLVNPPESRKPMNVGPAVAVFLGILGLSALAASRMR